MKKKKKKKNDKKETVGKIALDLMNQEQENKDPVAQQQAMLEDFERNFYEAFERGKTQFQGDFYVVIITKKERLMGNVLRNYFLVRESCPTPEFDQSVYRCDRKLKSVDLLWTVPNIQACDIYRNNVLQVPKEERQLLRCVLDFYAGTLLKKCKELNGELTESTVSDSFDPKDFEDQENLIIQK